ncbi:hypothetical protein [Caenibacillus caldisaponilyticus]|uniref:hypothetical protein n=1 Tax=Caenibacillus caldisaponilyticus TaxID=1674942 RepID=UPI001EE6A1CF|nr:hypothetical protein [Caenibacillus caldisaponilyticus]
MGLILATTVIIRAMVTIPAMGGIIRAMAIILVTAVTIRAMVTIPAMAGYYPGHGYHHGHGGYYPGHGYHPGNDGSNRAGN